MEKSEKCQQEFVKEKDGSGQRKKTKVDEASRIVGGHPARRPMPWMVLIFSQEYDWKCGGSLVCTNQKNYFEKKKNPNEMFSDQQPVRGDGGSLFLYCWNVPERIRRGREPSEHD